MTPIFAFGILSTVDKVKKTKNVELGFWDKYITDTQGPVTFKLNKKRCNKRESASVRGNPKMHVQAFSISKVLAYSFINLEMHFEWFTIW